MTKRFFFILPTPAGEIAGIGKEMIMKIRIFTVLLLCVLLTGCFNTPNPPEQPTESVPAETIVEETEIAAVIQPLPDTTMESIRDSIVHVSFGQEDVYQDDSGNICLRVQVYSYDQFDMVDISGLKAGDTILATAKRLKAAPGEMEKLTIKQELLASITGEITVSLEEV